jgi:hypothetical protein
MKKKPRNIGKEILQGIREIKAGKYGRVTRVPPAKQRAARKRLAKLRRLRASGTSCRRPA